MRFVVLIVVSLVLVAGLAHAQSEYPMVNIVEQVADSVVAINVDRVRFGGLSSMGGGRDSRYETFTTRRLTGIVYTENGYIITEERGIGDAEILTVVFDDGTELDAILVGQDEVYGVSVLKVESDVPLVAAEIVQERYDWIDNVYPYDQGDAVVAVGSSGGYGGTVTFGIISSVRNFRNRNRVLIPNMIQADVAINSGNQGCPLFNEYGQVIGYHDQIGMGNRGPLENITFFLPMFIVTRIADEIISNFENSAGVEDYPIWHPWLGISTFSGSLSPFTGQMRTVDPQLKMFLDVPEEYWDIGILIDEVWQESPAREFGIRPRDMLMTLVVQDANEDIKVDYHLLDQIEYLELLVTTADRDEIFNFGLIRYTKDGWQWIDVQVVVGQTPNMEDAVMRNYF